MEHIFFEAQLCSEIAVFKEKSNFWYIYHSTLAPSLQIRARDSLPGYQEAPPNGDGSEEFWCFGKKSDFWILSNSLNFVLSEIVEESFLKF